MVIRPTLFSMAQDKLGPVFSMVSYARTLCANRASAHCVSQLDDLEFGRSLAGQAGITANQISVMGMLAGLAGGLCFAATTWTGPLERVWWLLAAVCIQGRLLANLLDGMVAIESNKASPVGELYNEVPDRVSDSAIMIGAGFAVGGDPILGFAASLAAMFTAYVRAQGKAAVRSSSMSDRWPSSNEWHS